jgi:hypothetical protein
MTRFGSLYGKIREAVEVTPPEYVGEEDTGNDFNQEMIRDLHLVPPKKKRQDYDPEQLDIGSSVEEEHTSDPELAAIIAANHLDEIPDYYTRLKEMEEEAKGEKGGDLDLEAEEGPSLEDEEEKAKPMQNMEGVVEESRSNESNGFEKERNRAQGERNRRKSMLALRGITGEEADKIIKNYSSSEFDRFIKKHPMRKKDNEE